MQKGKQKLFLQGRENLLRACTRVYGSVVADRLLQDSNCAEEDFLSLSYQYCRQTYWESKLSWQVMASHTGSKTKVHVQLSFSKTRHFQCCISWNPNPLQQGGWASRNTTLHYRKRHKVQDITSARAILLHSPRRWQRILHLYIARKSIFPWNSCCLTRSVL